MREQDARVLGEIPFDLLPVVVIGADAFAVAANRQQSGEPLDVRNQPERTLTDVNARAELVGIERFREVVVGAGFEAGHEILPAVPCRQQDHVHRRTERRRADAAASSMP